MFINYKATVLEFIQVSTDEEIFCNLCFNNNCSKQHIMYKCWSTLFIDPYQTINLILLHTQTAYLLYIFKTRICQHYGIIAT